MRPTKTYSWLAVLAAVLVAAWGASGQESPLDRALDETGRTVIDGATAQAQIDTMADETSDLLARYRDKSQELDRLTAYNRHLETLVDDQQAKLDRMDDELAGALVVQQEIVPLMNSMIENLAAFIAADKPILSEERSERLQTLRDHLADSDITTAEKYRQIMEAYKIEMDIGRKIGTYSGTVTRNGQTQSVNFLYVGRILLAYQSEDRSVTAFWNDSTAPPGWEDLADEYRGHIDNAMRIANKQAAPSLMKLPVAAPEAVR